jgi:uracil-DNA glycosylase family 4
VSWLARQVGAERACSTEKPSDAESAERGGRPNSLMESDKDKQLEEIAEGVRNLRTSPLYDYRQAEGYLPVVGEGDASAQVMFVGEAPGAEEAKTGRPFVGRAGEVFEQLLHTIGLERGEVYVTSILKDRPPGNRDPRSDEIRIYKPFLLRQIEVIRPQIIATLGRFALGVILKEFDTPQGKAKLGDLHGKVLHAQAPYGEVIVIPLYHPAAVFYNPALQETMEADFQNLARLTRSAGTAAKGGNAQP